MLTLKLLGNVTLRHNGDLLEGFRSRKVVALLIYLAHTGRPHQRETLADLLWDSSTTKQALSNLRTVLSYLRRRLAEYVIADGSTLAFNHESRYRLDTDAFQQYIVRIGDGPISAVAAAHLEKGLTLYRGDFLADFHLRGTPRFNEWATVERERLHRLAVQGYRRLTEFYLDNGANDAGIAAARRWVALNELDEAAHLQLMHLLALSGQRSAALAQYEACRDILDEELGVPPGPAIMALHERIEAGKFAKAPARRSAAPVMQPTSDDLPIQYELPSYNTEFVGREAELAALEAAIADDEARLITITGAGGMGKTRLAVASAMQQRTAVTEPRFPQGVYFISLAALHSGERLAPALAETLGLALSAGDSQSPAEQVLAYLRRQRMLLILDNFEHLLPSSGDDPATHPAVNFVKQITQTAPKITVLVTSRQPLELPRERVTRITGLPGPRDDAPVELIHYPAVRLFLQSARRIRPDYAVSEAGLRCVNDICRLLAGMPLAIELAASWVDALPLADIAAEVRDDLDFLEALRRDIPDRQRSMRAVIAHSWQRLSPNEQTVFRELAVFHGGFTVSAADAVVGASRRTLAMLAKKSLLQFDPTHSCYHMHALLRQYAADKLARHADRQRNLHDRHSGYYLAWLAEQKSALEGTTQKESADAIDVDLDNVRRAWAWAVEHKQWDRLYAATHPLNRFYAWRGYQLAGAEECRQAADALVDVHLPEAKRTLARLLGWRTQYALYFGDVEAAGRLRNECEAILDGLETDDVDIRDERAFWLRERGKSLRKSDLDASRRCYEQAIALYRELGDTWNVTMTLSWLNDVVGRADGLEASVRVLSECLALQESIGDRRGAAFSLLYLGSIDLRQSRLDEARRKLQRALAYHRELDDHHGIELALHSLGNVHGNAGRFRLAREALQESLHMARQVGQYVVEKDNLLALGRTALLQQNFSQAEEYFRQAIAVSRDLEYLPTVADGLGFLGLTYLYAGQAAKAQETLEESVSLCSDIEYGHGYTNWQATLGCAALHAGNEELARCLTESLEDDEPAGVPLRLMLLALDDTADTAQVRYCVDIAGRERNRWLLHEHTRARALAGVAAVRSNQHEPAWQYLCDACRRALDTRAAVPLLYALTGFVMLCHEAGERECAVRLYALLQEHAFVANSRWFAVVLAETIAAVTDELPAETVAAALTSGRSDDLWATADNLLTRLTSA